MGDLNGKKDRKRGEEQLGRRVSHKKSMGNAYHEMARGVGYDTMGRRRGGKTDERPRWKAKREKGKATFFLSTLSYETELKRRTLGKGITKEG